MKKKQHYLRKYFTDFLLTVHIYETCGKLSPGELTDLRSALVNNIIFACLAVRYGLHTALLQHAPKLFEIIDRFVKFQEQRNHVVDDEVRIAIIFFSIVNSFGFKIFYFSAFLDTTGRG